MSVQQVSIQYPISDDLKQGSQTHIDLRVTFKRKMLRGPQFKVKKIPRATKPIKSLQIKVNFVKNYCCVSFLDERGPHKCTWRPRV